MKPKTIVPCPGKFLAAGFKSMIDAAVLVQVGRSGLQGCTLAQIADGVKNPRSLSLSTAQFSIYRLRDRGWVTAFCRQNARGRAYHWTVTVKGWNLLTQEPDVALFPDALKPVVK